MARIGWPVIGVGIAALAAGTAFAGTQYANRASVSAPTPAPGAAVATSTPVVAFRAGNVEHLSDLKVTLNGRDVTPTLGRTADGRVVVPMRGLKDGSHRIDVRASTRNVFSRSVAYGWDFEVDTTKPTLKVASPKPDAEIGKRQVPFRGTTEPGARVTIAWKGGKRTVTAKANGAWATQIRMKEGPAKFTLRSADRAGNAIADTRAVTVDTKAPRLTLAKVATEMTETDAPVFSGSIAGETPDRVTVGATINGRVITPAKAGATTASTTTSTSADPSVTFDGNRFTVTVGTLPQGLNRVTVFAADPAGNRSQKAFNVRVDSTEEFGSKDMVQGARGDDVRRLQQSLVDRGFKKVKVTGVFDARTTQGVRNYQRVHKLSTNGVFGPRTREAFVGKIVVDLRKFRLQLWRDGKVVRTHRVAIGAPGYPTPVGQFTVVNKQVDPTWLPPDSDWAKGLGPIPPGPGNPLGTRWIGTSAPAVGIHGTYADGSIGTAASHGCIRMHIPEVEALFEEVSVGMPVIIRP